MRLKLLENLVAIGTVGEEIPVAKWVRGLLSLSFWREHCGAAKGINKGKRQIPRKKRLKIAKVLEELSTNRDSLVNVNSGQKAAYELIIAVYDWE